MLNNQKKNGTNVIITQSRCWVNGPVFVMYLKSGKRLYEKEKKIHKPHRIATSKNIVMCFYQKELIKLGRARGLRRILKAVVKLFPISSKCAMPFWHTCSAEDFRQDFARFLERFYSCKILQYFRKILPKFLQNLA